MAEWQLQDAKNRLSEVVRRAREEGPQTVTVHGKPAAVILSAAGYARLTNVRKPLTTFLLEGPSWPDDLVQSINDRPRDTGRDIPF